MSAAARGAAFAEFAAEWTPRVESALLSRLPPAEEPPTTLHRAMHHALFPGGKRLRPLLVLIGCRSVGGDLAAALPAAAAAEFLHTYSLVHDDLPCMDDDDLRRGRPTCHKVFGEAMALLAGDALLTLAFESVATAGSEAVTVLAKATGSRGMVGGQVADLEAEGGAGERTLERVQWIHDRKTGALITASLLVGAHAGARAAGAESGRGPAPETQTREADFGPLCQLLTRYGDLLGRAFQIADDCLDLTGSATELGKNPQADLEHDKLTWPAIAGLAASQRMAHDLAEQAAGLAEEVVSAAAHWRGTKAPLDPAVPLLQDVAFAAVDRRS